MAVSVHEAAARLGVSDQAVRQMAASGRIAAVKRGGAWWLDADAVERRRRRPPSGGRPLSAATAWSVLLLASDQPGGEALAAHAHHAPRARRWLAAHPLATSSVRLRTRARSESFDAHPSELSRLIARADAMRTGLSASELIGLHGGRMAAELYAPASHRATIVAEHALVPGKGPVLVRWVDDELWPVIAGEIAPRAAVLVDLLEADDPRARREAMRELKR